MPAGPVGRGAPMHVSKFYTFTASVMCQLAAGLAYCFSLYSAALKERFGYSQEQIEGVGSACNLGGYLSLPSGLFYDWMASRGHDHLGPRRAPVYASVSVFRAHLFVVQQRYGKDPPTEDRGRSSGGTGMPRGGRSTNPVRALPTQP